MTFAINDPAAINRPGSSVSLAAGRALALLAFAATALAANPAPAITAELARKCEAIVSAAFPPRQIGNPAAGSVKGNGKAQRDYYSKCVANGGKMDDAPSR